MRELIPRCRSRAAYAGLLAGLIGGLVLVSSGAHATFPGKNGKIAFARGTQGQEHIFTMGKDGHNLKRVTHLLGGDDTQPAISPNAKWIAFVHGGSKPGIFVVKVDGSHQRRLTSDASDADPAFLPNGRRILFARGSPPNRGIFIMRFNGHHERSLIDADLAAHPTSSPNGKRIAFEGDDPGPGTDPEISVARRDGSHVKQLTHNQAGDFDPNYAPGGRRITFSTDRRHDQLDIALMRADGSHQHLLTHDSAHDAHSVFSPNGNKIAFERQRGTGSDFNILVMQADGSQIRRLTQNQVDNLNPDWGPRSGRRSRVTKGRASLRRH
jgi:Tol biopolymer transport system component